MEAVKPAGFRRPFLWQRKALGKEKLFLKKGSYERKAGKACRLVRSAVRTRLPANAIKRSEDGMSRESDGQITAGFCRLSNPPPCTPFFLEKRKLYQRKMALQEKLYQKKNFLRKNKCCI